MKGSPLNDQLVDYMNGLFPAEDRILRSLRSEAVEAGLPSIQISEEQGGFLQVLLRAIGATKVLEIGTLGGYSAIMMARALPASGRLVSLEIDPAHAAFARRQIERAGLGDRIEIRLGPALEQLDTGIDDGPFDFVFIDADKQNYTRYLERVIPMVRAGGIIAGDNALSKGRVVDPDSDDASVRGIQEFNRAMAADPRIQSCIVPIGDGLCLGVVLGPG